MNINRLIQQRFTLFLSVITVGTLTFFLGIREVRGAEEKKEGPSEAKSLEIIDEKGSFRIPLLEKWRYLQDAFGLPHVLVSPEAYPERTSLSMTFTGITDHDLRKEKLKKGHHHYRQGRLQWAKSRNAKIKKFLPHKTYKTKEGNALHRTGVLYKMKGKIYEERSYFLECPKTGLIHLKSLSSDEKEKIRPLVEKMVRGVECMKGPGN